MVAASLFSAGERTRLNPKGYSESEYSFLDQSAREPVARIRGVLDQWYEHLPVPARASIRNRFSSDDPGHHLGALCELYVHEATRRITFEIDVDIGREDPEHLRPDFLLAENGPGFYLEATAALGASVLGDQASHTKAAALKEAIERVKAPGFFLGVDLNACGGKTPGRRDVTEPLQRWIDEHDPDDVTAELAKTGDVPRKVLRFDGWEVEVKAFPVNPEHRGDPDHRVIGSYSEGFAALDDATPLRRKLKSKAGRYGGLELPYVIAVLCAGDFIEDWDVMGALFGATGLAIDPATGQARTVRDPDALWVGPAGVINTSVSAVITIPQLSASAITAVEPTVWLNPWAARPLTVALPWRTKEAGPDGQIVTHDATRLPADIFELPDRWPVED